ncbi:hypothetical protein LSTR_LSTR012792 [Laodelphax striatellus]|uniref:BHLH domain-containing protein n=1 Tax=Laodelphax striatellus TaxID=195883 RepID=A0A482WME8_LAOST|nr:hypothetical protein LSTR_LSTR012792 [Laodelphax striatellus]
MLTMMNQQELLLQSITSDSNNNRSLGDKCYSLRPRTALKPHEDDLETDWRPLRGRTKKRPKQKPPPLSKYRRKTANARERSRMREINEAFEALRRAIPHLSTSSENPNEKLTKITTLRLAMKYISALNQALQEPEFESDADSLLSDYALTPTPAFSEHSSLTSDFSDNILPTVSFADPASFVSPDDDFFTASELVGSADLVGSGSYVFDDLTFATDFS